MEDLLLISPAMAQMPDAAGTHPLVMALKNGRTWDTGVECLIRQNPSCLSERDPSTGLYPFQLAALPPVECGREILGRTVHESAIVDAAVPSAGPPTKRKRYIPDGAELDRLNTVFQLLHRSPDLIR